MGSGQIRSLHCPPPTAYCPLPNDTPFYKKVCKCRTVFWRRDRTQVTIRAYFHQTRDLMEATMHCPSCGTEAPVGQKFCRACGLSLESFAQLLAELLPDAEDENVALARQRLRQLEKAGKIAGVIGGLAIRSPLNSLLSPRCHRRNPPTNSCLSINRRSQ